MKKAIIYILIVSTALFWGLSFIASRVLMRYMGPMEVLALRWGLAAVLFAVLVLFKVIKINVHGEGFKYALLAGILEPILYSPLEMFGINLTSASVSSMFIATVPCATLIIGFVFFHRKTNPLALVSIAMAFTGVLIFTVFMPGASAGGSILGYFFMLSAVVMASLYTFAAERAGDVMDPLETTAIMAFFGGIVFNIINLLMGNGFHAYATCFQIPSVALGIVFLGVCCSCICYFGVNRVVQVLDPALTNNLIGSSVTVIGIVGGIVILHETWGWYTVVGSIITIIGVALSSRGIDEEKL